jgi:hypothetical protein
MAAIKTEGTWECDVLEASTHEDNRLPIVRVKLRITSGPDAGQPDLYEGRVDGGKSMPFIARSLKAIGWQGKTLATLADDVKAWTARTGGKTTCEVKHWEIKKGERAGEKFSKVNGLGSGGGKPLAAMSRSTMADADEALARIMAAGGGGSDDVPHAADGDDIPFITSGGRY